MKVCFAHDFPMIRDMDGNVYSKGGFAYDIWKRYLKHFKEVTVVAREREIISDVSKYDKQLSLSSGPGVRFVSIPNLNSVKGKLINTKKAKKRIRNVLKKSDALIARLPSEIGKLSIKIAKEMQIPYLIELVGCPYDAYRFYGNIKGIIYAPISMIETKRIIKQSKFTIYVTKEYLQKKYPTTGRSINISNVNIKKINNDVIKKRIDSIKTVRKRTFNIGMIGSLNSKYKGFDKAIEYLSRIKPNFNNYEIHVLGNGNRGNFEDVIKKNNMESHVYFDGVKSSGEEVFKWLDNIDLYIQPSLTEGLPRALIEALSRGCLAVGSERGGIPELLQKKYLFDPMNFISFKNAIKNVMKDPSGEQILNNVKKSKEYNRAKLSQKRDSFLRKFIISEIVNKNLRSGSDVEKNI